ncbi:MULTISPECIES: universal stress protein [unclassified Mesorhizobium]|uniref:universal stress protein n=1 Tax=Mesorhizobium sp. TaxID=1871066 RepID=UPI000FCC8338|nr:hypothetical protein EOA31_25875 [Mesorhizobium sp. M4B.F.Ca.ET.049.02.1.2]RVD17829.1 hypothetical protein EN738_28210 [Mesorhizobium sp. M4B.F.Ca.ET.017.02.2.1]RWA66550.1 MAG: hypothetical protein EOQ27_01730 [Mesorhizobium sp.]TGV18237.1 hypothetical protein EN786_34490 [Mesorhizobium sp. M4B.F.Ca.ET.143.01.1.1]TIX18233.1 MAG: hypothetical protein E5V41_07000 [Mesorhizobium sp.]
MANSRAAPAPDGPPRDGGSHLREHHAHLRRLHRPGTRGRGLRALVKHATTCFAFCWPGWRPWRSQNSTYWANQPYTAETRPTLLLVVGTHGRSGLIKVLLGSVTESVLRSVASMSLRYRLIRN